MLRPSAPILTRDSVRQQGEIPGDSEAPSQFVSASRPSHRRTRGGDMNRRRLAIGSVVLLVAGCVATGGTPSPGAATKEPPAAAPTPTTPLGSDVAGIVPWSSEAPAPPATPPATPTPVTQTCRVDQLAAGGAAPGALLGGFLIWNTSGSPCRLEGRPSVAIVDATGRSLTVTEGATPSPPGQPIVL